jgi:ATP-dependent DNA helicase RecG
MLTYRRPTAEGSRDVVRAWLASHTRITSGDYAALTGLTPAGAKRALDRLVPDLLTRGPTVGRNAHYVAVGT